jgi:hypothetical protein
MVPPNQELVDRIQNIIGAKPYGFIHNAGGYTPTSRWTFRAGSASYFVKAATTAATARLLRREALAYQSLKGSFMPALAGWEDDDLTPILIIEDLSEAHWPPPWRPADIDRVLQTIHEMHATLASLPPYAGIHSMLGGNWASVAADPQPFLRLGLATPAWLEQALPLLLQAERQCKTDGNCLAHWDLRSDNICLTAQGVKFVDWAEACLSNPDLDLGFFLPSLAYEGGPQPEAVIGHRPEIAAWVAGFFAARAGLPLITDAPRVRVVQLQQLQTALPWVSRALELPEPGM